MRPNAEGSRDKRAESIRGPGSIISEATFTNALWLHKPVPPFTPLLFLIEFCLLQPKEFWLGRGGTYRHSSYTVHASLLLFLWALCLFSLAAWSEWDCDPPPLPQWKAQKMDVWLKSGQSSSLLEFLKEVTFLLQPGEFSSVCGVHQLCEAAYL